MVVMPHRRKTASSRVSGLLRTQRRYRRAFSLPPVRMWADRAQRKYKEVHDKFIQAMSGRFLLFLERNGWRRNGWSEPS
eukprot:COSAG05_NODE_6728_length_913_cov_0.820639_1_plen_78_part_10